MFQKLALAVFCIFCLVAINQAAPSDEPSSGGPKPTPPTGPADQMPKPGEPMDEDEDSDELVDFEDDEEDSEEEYEDADESPEGRLSELAEEHFAVKNDCTDIKTAIDESKEASEEVDPELLKSYDECKKYLHEIEKDIIELSSKLA